MEEQSNEIKYIQIVYMIWVGCVMLPEAGSLTFNINIRMQNNFAVKLNLTKSKGAQPHRLPNPFLMENTACRHECQHKQSINN